MLTLSTNAELALRVIAQQMPRDRKFTDDDLTPELANAAFDYAYNYEGDFEYMLDMQWTARRRGLTRGQQRGVLNCARTEILRREKWAAEDARRAKESTSEHVGQVGQRINFEGTIEMVRAFDSDYGTKYLVAIDYDGNKVKWFASVYPFEGRIDDAIGKRVKVRATVKAHGEYRGEKETLVTRAKLALVD